MITNMARVIAYQYPTAIVQTDWTAKDTGDGAGQVLTSWNTAKLGTQPTQQELEAIEASTGYAVYWSDPSVNFRASQLNGSAVVRRAGVRKSADESTTSTTFGDCADLDFDLLPTTSYRFRFTGAYATAAPSTGLQLSVKGPASPNFLAYSGQIFTGPTAIAAGVGASYDVALAAPSSGGATALPFTLEGTITTGSQGGTITLRVRTSAAGSAVTIKRGSIGDLDQVQ
jgi:hypothetical protein